MTERRAHFEVWSSGFDERLQGVGGDAYTLPYATGLRIPTLATASPASRYLFMLCGFQLAENVRARIRGWRQFWTLGAIDGSHNLIEQLVETPNFRMPHANVSWHLRQVEPGVLENLTSIGPAPVQPPVNNLAFRMSQTPALLYESCDVGRTRNYIDLTTYTPPNSGRPYGDPLGQLATAHDLRTPWRSALAWDSLDIPIEGPCFAALFASVSQTAAATHTAPTNPQGEPPEWQFIANYPSAVPWRVGGALIVDLYDSIEPKQGAQSP